MKIIVNLAGGFGNQMFCYALAYAMFKEKKALLFIDTSMQDNGIARDLEILNLNISYDGRVTYPIKKDLFSRALGNKLRKKMALGLITKGYYEKYSSVYEPQILLFGNDAKTIYYEGNWQSEKYFLKYRKELLQLFIPKNPRNRYIEEIREKMKNSNSVAIHVRRGDYVSIGCNISMDYYDKAIALMVNKIPNNPDFWIFSDDIAFCKEYFKKYENIVNLYYLNYQSDNYTVDDMYIMSACQNNIIANSSYSWWGAWLNSNENKIVICPQLGMWTGDFYPEKWIKIDC